MKKRNSVPIEDGNISLSATTNEIIHNGHFVPFFTKVKRDMRTDESATASDKNVQEVTSLQSLWSRSCCAIFPETEIPIWHITQCKKIHRQQIEPASAKICFCWHKEVISEMHEQRMAQPRAQRNAHGCA